MKSKYNPFRSPATHGAAIVFACFTVFHTTAQATDISFIGSAGDHNLTTGSNWVGGSPAGDWNRLIFGSAVVDGTLNIDNFNGRSGITLTSGVTQDITINGPQPLIMGPVQSDGFIDMSSAAHGLTINTPYWVWGSTNWNVGTGRTLTVNGGIVENSAPGITLTKDGAGTASITAASGYTGGTAINAGTLALSGSGTLGATTSQLSLNGGTLDLGGTTQTVGNINTTGGGTATLASTGGGGTLWVTNSTSFDLVFNGITFNQTGGALNYGGYGQVTDATLNLSGGSSFIGLENLLGWGGSNASVNISGTHVANWYVTRMESSSVTLNLQTGGTLYTDEIHSSASAGVVKFDGGTLGMSELNPSRIPGDWIHTNGGGSLTLYVENGGAIIDTNNGSATINLPFQKDGSSTGGLTKTGGNSLTLTATNTYTGATTVNGGTLILGQASLNNNADVKLTTGATLQLNFAATDIIDELLIDGLPQASGTWGRIGHPTAAHTTSLITGDGLLQVTTGPAGGYAGWASTNGATGQTPDQDHDNDGVLNGIEYFLNGGADSTGFTALPGVTDTEGILSVTWIKAASYTGTYGTDFVVETSSTLTGLWGTAGLGAGTNEVVISGNNVTYTFPASGGVNFARLKVTGP